MDLIEFLKEHSDSYFTFREYRGEALHFLNDWNSEYYNSAYHLYVGESESDFALFPDCNLDPASNFLVKESGANEELETPYWLHRTYLSGWTSLANGSMLKRDRLVIQTGKWKYRQMRDHRDEGKWHDTDYELRAGSDYKYYLYYKGARYRQPQTSSYPSDNSDTDIYSDESYLSGEYISEESYLSNDGTTSSPNSSSISPASSSSTSSSSSKESSNNSQNNGKKAKGGISILTIFILIVIAYFVIKAIT